jgi:hypothetical protein
MVHVRSQVRHRHSVNALMTLAKVPTIRPLQKGQVDGRSTVMPSRRSSVMVLASSVQVEDREPASDLHSRQRSRRGEPQLCRIEQ